MNVPTIIVTGPVGVGKTSVMTEIVELLLPTGIHFAAVDMDALSWCYPAVPGDDRFRSNLTFRNLAAVWENFRATGASRLVIARVIERRAEIERYRQAIPGAQVTVTRLRAGAATLEDRVTRREIGVALPRRLDRARELAKIMERERIEDVLVDTDGRSVSDIAAEVLARSGWGAAR